MLTNLNRDDTLLRMITEEVTATTGARAKRALVAITCYFDFDAIEALVRDVHKALRNAGGKLTRFYLFVDPGEWVKCRTTTDELSARIMEIVGPLEHIHIGPAWFDGRLFHAKSYALIGPRNTTSGVRRGFVAVTSGNLTRRGMGLDDNPNVEFVHLTDDPAVLEEVRTVTRDLVRNRRPPERYDRRNNDFFLGLSILGSGEFYHKWEGNLSSEVRFTLTLTEAGQAERRRNNQAFAGYDSDSGSISQDPINITRIFDQAKRPFPPRFWATYSVDTLLGRWVPMGIAEAIDRVLDSNVQCYVDEIAIATGPQALAAIKKKLRSQVRRFRKSGWIKETDEAVDRWEQKVTDLSSKTELISLRVLPYEKLPDILDTANRTMILKLVAHARAPEKLGKAPRGLKRILGSALNLEALDWKAEIDLLQSEAKLKLGHAE